MNTVVGIPLVADRADFLALTLRLALDLFRDTVDVIIYYPPICGARSITSPRYA